MTSHVIAYRSPELLFGTHTFNFNCFFDDFNYVFMQIRCLSRLLNPCKFYLTHPVDNMAVDSTTVLYKISPVTGIAEYCARRTLTIDDIS